MPNNPFQALAEQIASLQAAVTALTLRVTQLESDLAALTVERVKWAAPYRFPQPPLPTS